MGFIKKYKQKYGDKYRVLYKDPDAKFHFYWQTLVFLLIAWTAFEAPVTFIKTQKDVKSWQMLVDIFMTLVFAFDIYFNFQHQGKNNQQQQHFQLQGYHNYTKSIWLPLDILACIPFDVIAYSLGLEIDSNLYRGLRLIKLVRVFKVYSILTSMSLLPKGFKISTIMTSICVIIHWIACGWMIFGHPVQNAEFATQYNIALYWTITTLTTIGYGDITPTTNIARMYCMSIMLLGVGVYGIVIGNISKIIVGASKHKERVREKMQDLHALMNHYQVPRKVQNEVFGYYTGLAMQRLTDNDQKILSELPHNLKNELEVYMILKLVEKIPLFEGLKSHELKYVARHLEQEFYSPNENIIRKGKQGDKMYIISNGEVNVMNQDNEVISTLKTGQFFGEIALMMDIERGHNVEAKSYCDVYTLSKTNFQSLIERYEVLRENIQKVIVKRRGDKKKQDSENYKQAG